MRFSSIGQVFQEGCFCVFVVQEETGEVVQRDVEEPRCCRGVESDLTGQVVRV